MSRGGLWTVVAIVLVALVMAVVFLRVGEPPRDPDPDLPPAEVPPVAVPPAPHVPVDPLPTPEPDAEVTPTPEAETEATPTPASPDAAEPEAAGATIPPEGARTVTITGTVLDYEERLGLGGALVRLVPAPESAGVLQGGGGLDAEANAAGRFRFDAVPHGTYRLAVQAGDKVLHSARPGSHIASSASPTSILNSAAEEEEISLSLLVYPGYRIAGRAVDGATEGPVEGAGVSVESLGNPLFGVHPTRIEAVTNERGRFDFSQVVADTEFRVSVDSKDHEMETGFPTEWSAGDQRLNAISADLRPHTLDQEVLLQLRSVVFIAGQVVTPTGVPVRDAEINAVYTRVSAAGGSYMHGHSDWIRVDAEGNFHFPAPARSRVALRARRGTHTTQAEMLEIGNEPVEGIEIVLGAAGSISGRFLFPDGYSSAEPGPYAPVPDAWTGSPEPRVILFPAVDGPSMGAASTGIGPDGGFLFVSLSAGVYRLTARHPSFPHIGPEHIELEAGEHRADVIIDLRERGVIDLAVLDEEGQPVTDVQTTFMVISTRDDGGIHEQHLNPMRPGEEGRLRLLGLTGREYNVQVRPQADFRPLRTGPFPLDGEPRVLTLEREETGHEAPVTVYLFDARTGRPVRAELYTAERRLGDRGRPVAEMHGGYFVDPETDPRQPAFYTIRSTTYATKEVHVPPGEGEREALAELHRGSEVHGRVVPAVPGVSVADLRVAIYSSPGDESTRWHLLRHGEPAATAFTAGDGSFRFHQVPPGEAVVYLLAAPGLAPAYARVDVPMESGDVDCGSIPAGPGGLVRFRVVNPETGRPYAGMRVTLAGDFGLPSRHGVVPQYNERTTDEEGVAVYTGLASGAYTPHAQVLNATPAEPVEPPRISVDHGSETEILLRAHMDPNEELVHATWEVQ